MVRKMSDVLICLVQLDPVGGAAVLALHHDGAVALASLCTGQAEPEPAPMPEEEEESARELAWVAMNTR